VLRDAKILDAGIGQVILSVLSIVDVAPQGQHTENE
jgi:hypothetical protein